ncbi:hypothetical protein BJ878DRAFT_287217 [Calycina marina]|uniref:Cyclin-like domain-containing protein n=1 Tax=Calycina marina TaxID=1763456 RepID=A0A9P7ZB93_9HELO|nr:hypothetical protein BJ878DRAFT_287217 [Calycina marina]
MGRKPLPPVRQTPRAPKLPTPAVHGMKRMEARKKPSRVCPNKECDDPNVVEGTCHGCGAVLDDSNIVSEITFGENSAGGAIVQGTYVSATQGTATGLTGHNVATQGNRHASKREAKEQMDRFARLLKIPQSVVDQGNHLYSLASSMNFIQGRRIDQVSAVCLYTAHRLAPNGCNSMLIDYADILQIPCHKLGTTYNNLHSDVTLAPVKPVNAEDLMYRFASGLDFGPDANKIAGDAIKISRRMAKDWIHMGRRPSGVCGAALIMAARMNNYLRSPLEVTYVVKITTHTIQERMKEFKMTPASKMSINDFLTEEFANIQAMDPPAFYKSKPGYKKNGKKRKHSDEEGEEEEVSASDATTDVPTGKRQKTTNSTPAPVPRCDVDGFAVPSRPNGNSAIDPNLPRVAHMLDDDLDEEQREEDLVATALPFGEKENDNNHGLDGRWRRMHVPRVWSADELAIAACIEEVIMDHRSEEHAVAYARAEQRVDAIIRLVEHREPDKGVSNDANIDEDEFKDDWEVQNCVLDQEAVREKEMVWVNKNKGWLRAQQIKEFERKKAENGAPKAKHPRKKISRIGEDVESAATPEEAVAKSMEKRGFSRKLNPEKFTQGLFDVSNFKKGNFLGSRAGSLAPSTVEDESGDEDDDGPAAPPAVREPSIDIDDGEDDEDEEDDEEGDEDDDEFAQQAKLDSQRMATMRRK